MSRFPSVLANLRIKKQSYVERNLNNSGSAIRSEYFRTNITADHIWGVECVIARLNPEVLK